MKNQEEWALSLKSSKSILIVEDEAITSMEIRKILENFGYHVTNSVATGKAAINSVTQSPPDLVLMDIQLQGEQDGVSTANIIREQFDLPVIFLTANSDTKTLERATHTQPFGIILKPFTPQQIQSSIEIATYKHLLEKILRERELWYSNLFTCISDGIIVSNIQKIVTFMNPVAERWTGWSKSDLSSEQDIFITELFQTTQEFLGAKLIDSVMEEGMFLESTKMSVVRRGNGSITPVEVSASPIRNTEGEITGAAVVLHDITAQLQAEQIMEEQNIKLTQSNQALDDFSSTVSHDLKEPLRGIKSFARILIEDYGPQLNEDGRTKCQTLVHLAERMEDFIETLLYFSQLGHTELAMGHVELQKILQDILHSLKISLREYGVTIRIPRPLPIVYCDYVRVGEIFRNLITNAMKYNDKSEKWIEIGYQEEGPTKTDEDSENVIFYVKDNGIGIKEKDYKKIFTIFKRLHARDKFGGGTGAGLSITKKLVEKNEGKIWLESIFGEGSTFFFTLPKQTFSSNDVPSQPTSSGNKERLGELGPMLRNQFL